MSIGSGGIGNGGGGGGDGFDATVVPYAYLYHDATNQLVTPLLQNVPSEVDMDGMFPEGNFFTNTGDGLLTSTSSRSYKALVHHDISYRNNSGSDNVQWSLRKNGIATGTGEYIDETMLTATEANGISRIITIANTDTVALWIVNTGGNDDLKLFGCTCTITWLGWTS